MDFDTAQVCLNGHVMTPLANMMPDLRKKYCPTCGERTIMECPDCQAEIQGQQEDDISDLNFTTPQYCHNCGHAFPWTERAIKAALALFAEEVHDDVERQVFAESVEEIARNTPQAQVAGFRIGKLLQKMGPPAARVIRDLLINMASAQATKGLGG